MPDGHRRVTLQVTAVDDQFGTHRFNPTPTKICVESVSESLASTEARIFS